MLKSYQISYIMKKTNSYVPQAELLKKKSSRLVENLQFVCAFNRNLVSTYGYSMSAELIERVANELEPDIVHELDNMEDHLKKDVLGDIDNIKLGKPFYKNFPEEVMEKDEIELYINALIYYAGGTYGLHIDGIRSLMEEDGLLDSELKKRPELITEFSSVKYINRADESIFTELLSKALSSRTMPSWERDVLFKYAGDDTKGFIKLLRISPIENHDIKAYVCAWLYNNGNDDTVLDLYGKELTGRDILRIIQLISIKNDSGDDTNRFGIVRNDTDISPKSFKIHLFADDKRFIKDLIAASKSIFKDIWLDEKVWKIVMKHIHPRKGQPRSVALFDHLYNKDKTDEDGRPVLSPAAKIDADLREQSVSGLMMDAENYSGVFMRNAIRIITHMYKFDRMNPDTVEYTIRDIMKAASENADPILSLQVANAIGLLQPSFFSDEGVEDRYSRTSGGKLIKQKKSSSVRLSKSDCIKIKSAMLLGISKGLDSAFKADVPVGNIYIEPALSGIKVPQRQDTFSASDGCALPTGSVVDLDSSRNIILFGIWWYNKDIRYIDIDLAVHFYKTLEAGTSDNSVTVDYTIPTTDFAVHSGDFTESDPYQDGSGAIELVAIDKELMRKAGYRYAVAEVNDYNGTFEKSGKVRAFMMSRNGSLDIKSELHEWDHSSSDNKHFCFKGELIEPALFDINMIVSGNGKSKLTQMIDIEDSKMLILDTPYSAYMDILSCEKGDDKKGARHIERVSDDAALAIVNIAEHNTQPSIYEVVFRYLSSNGGTLVKSPEDADTIFSVYPLDGEKYGGAETYSTLNISDFLQKIIVKKSR